MTGFTRLPSNTPPINEGQFVSSDTTHHRLSRYGPLVVWAALIFIGSGSALSGSNTSVVLRTLLWLFPHVSEATLAQIHFLIRKAGHLTEYAILALLAARAFRTSAREVVRARWFWVSLLLVVVYSLSDEFHQSFVPSRTASIYDSMIDSVGGLVALTMLWRRRHEIGKGPAQETSNSSS